MAKRKRNRRPLALLDIIIPVHNRYDMLYECLKALPDACGDISKRIVIVDNGSNPDDRETFYQNFEGSAVKLLRHNEALGFPRACNTGARNSASPLILLLNSDVVMEPGSIAKMVKTMDDPGIGVLGAKLFFSSDTNQGPPGTIQHIGLASNIRGEIIHPFIAWSADNPYPDRRMDGRDLLAVTGACFMTRRNIWQQLKGFDESYGLGTYEEVDYCMRVRELGRRIRVEVEAIGTHFVGASVMVSEARGYPLHENKMKFLARWGSSLPWTEWEVL